MAMPLIMIASCGFSPMISGKTNVAPNIATTCWAPRPTVRPQDSRSSGATASPGGGVLPSCTTFQPIAMLDSHPSSAGVTRDDVNAGTHGRVAHASRVGAHDVPESSD